MKPLRIAYVLEATAGGTRKHLRELVSGMCSHGHAVMVVVNQGREPDFGEDITWYKGQGCEVAVIPMGRNIQPLKDAIALLRIARALRRFKPDVIHTHAAKAGALGRLASLFVPHAAVVHTPHTLPYDWAEGAVSAVYRLLEAGFGRLTDAAVALTNAQARRMIEARTVKLGTEPRVIANGVSKAAGLARDEVRKRWDIKPGEIVVAQVARLAPQKACGVFVEAAARVKEDKARFILMGDGPLKDVIARDAASLGLGPGKFRMAGYVPHAEHYYAGIDILVLTSLYEGLSYVVLEGMSAGLPVIAPGIPGMDEVIEDGRSGILAPVGDAPATAEAISRLISDRGLRETLGDNARKEVETRFTSRRFIEEHLRLYEGCQARVQIPAQRLPAAASRRNNGNRECCS